MTSSDRFPVPVRSAVKSNLTDWCFQNLSKRALNALTVQASTTELGKRQHGRKSHIPSFHQYFRCIMTSLVVRRVLVNSYHLAKRHCRVFYTKTNHLLFTRKLPVCIIPTISVHNKEVKTRAESEPDHSEPDRAAVSQHSSSADSAATAVVLTRLVS